MLESVVLICGHCQGLLLHLRITFDPSQWWTLISVALSRTVEAALLAVFCSYQSSFTAITASLPAAARPASHAVTVPDTTTAAHSAHKRGAGMFISIVQ